MPGYEELAYLHASKLLKDEVGEQLVPRFIIEPPSLKLSVQIVLVTMMKIIITI